MGGIDSVLTIIVQSALALFAIVGTLTIFRLQWFRKELDDYRLRVIHFMVFPRQVNNEPAQGLEDYAVGYQLSDRQLKSKAEKHLRDYPGLRAVTNDHVGDGTTFQQNVEMLRKRYEGKASVQLFFSVSTLVLLLVFSITILRLLSPVSREQTAILLVLVILEYYYLFVWQIFHVVHY